MKRTKNFIVNLWIAFVIVFFTAIRTEGQIIKVSILADPTSDNAVPLSGTFATGTGTINFQFTLDGGTATGNWGLSGCSVSPCPVVFDNASTGAAHITVPSTATQISFDVNVSGGTIERHVTINFRNPVDFVLVLDKSGSMSSSSGTTTRWEALKTAVGAFVEKFEEWKVDGDRISITYFHSVVENGFGTPANSFIDIRTTPAPSSNSQISTSLQPPNGPAGSTAMGEGMLDAKTKLLPVVANRTRIELLFTDGYQNSGRLVDDATGTKLSDNTPINEGSPGIRIYTIGIIPAGAIPGVLNAIASNNNGKFFNTQEGSEATFKNDFTNTFKQILSTSSPQILGTYRGKANGPSHLDSATFTCNQGVSKLIFELYSPGRLQVGFEKDGKTVVPSRVRSGPGYFIYVFNFPHSDITIKPGGKWKVKMVIPGVDVAVANTGNRSFTYDVTAIADDHLFEYPSSLGSQKFKPGDDLKPGIKLSLLKKEVTNAHVDFILLKPGQTLGNLLATTNISINAATGPDTSSAGIRKYEQLLNDPAFLAKMLPKEQSFNLSHTGQGNYGSTSIKLDTSGVYRVIFLISDTLSNGDIIQRREEQTLYVQFDDIDIASSNPVLAGSGTQWTLTIRPMTKQKLFVGPAFHQVFNLTSSGIALKNVIDVGDGSYELKLEGDPSSNVDLTLLGVPVYTGKLSNINSHSGGGSIIDKIRNWLAEHGIPEWLFWLFLILLLLFIIWLFRRKK